MEAPAIKSWMYEDSGHVFLDGNDERDPEVTLDQWYSTVEHLQSLEGGGSMGPDITDTGDSADSMQCQYAELIQTAELWYMSAKTLETIPEETSDIEYYDCENVFSESSTNSSTEFAFCLSCSDPLTPFCDAETEGDEPHHLSNCARPCTCHAPRKSPHTTADTSNDSHHQWRHQRRHRPVFTLPSSLPSESHQRDLQAFEDIMDSGRGDGEENLLWYADTTAFSRHKPLRSCDRDLMPEQFNVCATKCHHECEVTGQLVSPIKSDTIDNDAIRQSSTSWPEAAALGNSATARGNTRDASGSSRGGGGGNGSLNAPVRPADGDKKRRSVHATATNVPRWCASRESDGAFEGSPLTPAISRELLPARTTAHNFGDFESLDGRIESLTFDFEQEERCLEHVHRADCEQHQLFARLLQLVAEYYRLEDDWTAGGGWSHRSCDGGGVGGGVGGRTWRLSRSLGELRTAASADNSAATMSLSRRSPHAVNGHSVENLSEDSGYGDRSSPPRSTVAASAAPPKPRRLFHQTPPDTQLQRLSRQLGRSVPELSPGTQRRGRLWALITRDEQRCARVYSDAPLSDCCEPPPLAVQQEHFQNDTPPVATTADHSCLENNEHLLSSNRPIPAPRMAASAVYMNIPSGAHVARSSLQPCNFNSSGNNTSDTAVVDRQCATNYKPDVHHNPIGEIHAFIEQQTNGGPVDSVKNVAIDSSIESCDSGGEKVVPRDIYLSDEEAEIVWRHRSTGRPKPLDLKQAEEFLLLESVESDVVLQLDKPEEYGAASDEIHCQNSDETLAKQYGSARSLHGEQMHTAVRSTYGHPLVGALSRSRSLVDLSLLSDRCRELLSKRRPFQSDVVNVEPDLDDASHRFSSGGNDAQTTPAAHVTSSAWALPLEGAEEPPTDWMGGSSCSRRAGVARVGALTVFDCDSTECGELVDRQIHLPFPTSVNSMGTCAEREWLEASMEPEALEPTRTGSSACTVDATATRVQRWPVRAYSGRDSQVEVFIARQPDVVRSTRADPVAAKRSKARSVHMSPVVSEVKWRESYVHNSVPKHETKPALSSGSNMANSSRQSPPTSPRHALDKSIEKVQVSFPVLGQGDTVVRHVVTSERRTLDRPAVGKPILVARNSGSLPPSNKVRNYSSSPVVSASPNESSLEKSKHKSFLKKLGFNKTPSGKTRTAKASTSSIYPTSPSSIGGVPHFGAEAVTSTPLINQRISYPAYGVNPSVIQNKSPTVTPKISPLQASPPHPENFEGSGDSHLRSLSPEIFLNNTSASSSGDRSTSTSVGSQKPPLPPQAFLRSQSQNNKMRMSTARKCFLAQNQPPTCDKENDENISNDRPNGSADNGAVDIKDAFERFRRSARQDREQLAKSSPDISTIENVTRRSIRNLQAAKPVQEVRQGVPSDPPVSKKLQEAETAFRAARRRILHAKQSGLVGTNRYQQTSKDGQLLYQETDLDTAFRSNGDSSSNVVRTSRPIAATTDASTDRTKSMVNLPLEETADNSRAKSMEFLMDDANKAATMPPENQLALDGGRQPSQLQLRFQRSLRSLNVPDWYRRSYRAESTLKRHSSLGGSQAGAWSASKESVHSNWSSVQTAKHAHSPTDSHHDASYKPGGVATRHRNISNASSAPYNRRDDASVTSSTSSWSRAGSYRLRGRHQQQPYLGWRSEERLAATGAPYLTPSQRLAGSLAATKPAASADIEDSIRKMSSAIVRYFDNGQPGAPSSSNDQNVWRETSFVGADSGAICAADRSAVYSTEPASVYV